MVENLKIRQIKLAARDFKNKITGKQNLIDEYNVITDTIAKACDKEPSKTEHKAQLLNAYETLNESKWTTTDFGFAVDGFNPYHASKHAVKAKVELGRILLSQLGLTR